MRQEYAEALFYTENPDTFTQYMIRELVTLSRTVVTMLLGFFVTFFVSIGASPLEFVLGGNARHDLHVWEIESGAASCIFLAGMVVNGMTATRVVRIWNRVRYFNEYQRNVETAIADNEGGS
jgi:hypothetical protein